MENMMESHVLDDSYKMQLPGLSKYCLGIKDTSTNNNSMNAIFERVSMGKDAIKNNLPRDTKCLQIENYPVEDPRDLLPRDVTAQIRESLNLAGNKMRIPIESSNRLIDNKIQNGTVSSKIYNDDHSLLNDVGYSFVISDKLLGHGSYGDVFLATDENSNTLAVKCCDIDATGIPNILEASIMGSVIHPHLNRALRIQASDTKLYIIQELAVSDLAQHTRRDKGNHKPTIDELRQWSFCLVQAVSALHKDNIIHADIKASNILLYSDGSIRLTDYTLATKKWSHDEKFTHNVCTCTHRPLECLLRRPWDESLDIWSLGCTLYEIAYGELLFPYQGVLDTEHKPRDREAKTRLRNRAINTIIDWSSRGPNPPTPYEVVGIHQYPIDYIPFILCEDFKRPEMSGFNDLLCKMLIVDPRLRPTIKEIINHPFFNSMKSPIYLSVKRPLNKIAVTEQYTNNSSIQAVALNLYCKCNDIHVISEHIRAAACTWIASKLVVGYPPTITLPLNQILSAEREICHNLLFRLHQI
jgi:serine/threonine protein kinase